MEVQAYSERTVIRFDGEIVADHPRSLGRGETIHDPMHYLPVLRCKPGAPFVNWQLPAAMQQVCEKLTEFADGNRQMETILRIAEQLGLECLEKACQFTLADGLYHADVVLNHAHRLMQPGPAKMIASSVLKVQVFDIQKQRISFSYI